MDLPLNLFKRRLLAGETQIGFWSALADPYAVEVCAGAGFDWLLIDAEHAPNDLRSLLAALQAAAACPTASVVRPPNADPSLIKQYLDIGAQTLLVPMIDTPQQAAEVVRATRYPPAGVRGVGSGISRGGRWGRIADYAKRAEEQICVLVQAETVEALSNLEAIAATPGVDGVFIGPSDLAASMGLIGQPGHPDVQAAVRTAGERLRAVGKPAGVLSLDEPFVRSLLGGGYSFVAVGTDVGVLARGAERLAKSFSDRK
jgi:4-hydroxy-2-oxoheptanedioate aldolase